MRPGRFHPGNSCREGEYRGALPAFNEAGAFPPRKYQKVVVYAGYNVGLQ